MLRKYKIKIIVIIRRKIPRREKYISGDTTSNDTMAMALLCLAVLALSIFVRSIANALGVTDRMLGKKYATTLIFCATLVFLMPLSLIFSNCFALNGVCYSTVIANALSAIVAISVRLFFKEKLL